MKIREIIKVLEYFAPLSLQETYDNSGLIIGEAESEVDGALITLDVTPEVIDEAISLGYQLIISHHPVVFQSMKRFNGANYTEKVVMKAIKAGIAIYSIHTNLDNILQGVNKKICEKIGLTDCRILKPDMGRMRKLVTFCPIDHADRVREAIFSAGAGWIGNYDSCSFNAEGVGSFRAGDKADPYVGEIGELHYEKEVRIETIFPEYIERKVVGALLKAHPYEEVAYDIYRLENISSHTGSGMIGDLAESSDEMEFLLLLKEKFDLKVIRHTRFLDQRIKTVAVCGGSGSIFIADAIRSGAQVFITSDVKYHQFFEADGQILIADIGHYESEQFTTELIFDILTKNFANFALRISKTATNPVSYL